MVAVLIMSFLAVSDKALFASSCEKLMIEPAVEVRNRLLLELMVEKLRLLMSPVAVMLIF